MVYAGLCWSLCCANNKVMFLLEKRMDFGMKKIIVIFLISLLLAGCDTDMQGSGSQDSETQQGALTDSTEMTESIMMQETEIENAVDTEDGSIEWDEKQVVIPEVEGEYEIWFFADSHIIIPDDTDTEEIQAYAAERLPVFTNEKGVAPSQILTEFIEAANEQKPDMVLFGGDILDFPSEANVAFLKEEMAKLTVPYMYVMGNHDWTFPWAYMTPEGAAQYRPLYEEMMYGNLALDSADAEKTASGEDSAEEIETALDVIRVSADSYSSVVELEEIVFLAVDDSSNQVAAEAVENIEYAYGLDKPVVLVQHVPFSTEKLIAEAKNYWANPVTLGMQVHGGLAPNDVSADLFSEVRDDDSNIRVVLAGHVHFPYEEQISAQTVEIITDAAFKGKAVKLRITSK